MRLALLGIAACAVLVLLGAGCILAGTKGCASWREQDDQIKCRRCPDFIECVKPLPKFKENPSDG